MCIVHFLTLATELHLVHFGGGDSFTLNYIAHYRPHLLAVVIISLHIRKYAILFHLAWLNSKKLGFTRPVTRGGEAPLEKFRPAGKMCWTYSETIVHSLKNLSPCEKTLRPPWCPKVVTGLGFILFLRYSHKGWIEALVVCSLLSTQSSPGLPDWPFWVKFQTSGLVWSWLA